VAEIEVVVGWRRYVAAAVCAEFAAEAAVEEPSARVAARWVAEDAGDAPRRRRWSRRECLSRRPWTSRPS
jgi:hypothetical protein